MMDWLEDRGYVLQGPFTFKFIRTLHYTSSKVRSKRCILSLYSFRIEKRNAGGAWEIILEGYFNEFVVGRAGSLTKNGILSQR